MQHPADHLSATGYLHEYWVAGTHVVKLAVTHVNFDKKETALRAVKVHTSSNLRGVSSDPTRCS